MVPPDSHRISRVPRYSGCRYASHGFVYGAFARYGKVFQPFPLTMFLAISRPYNPMRAGTRMVWALPRSLATTGGISLDFSSSGYLDVSVPRVAPSGPMCSARRRRASTARRVFPFGDPRVQGRVPLTADYRSLPRPSSASCAKASAACPYHLPSISDGMVLRLIGPLLRGPGCHIA